MEKESRAVVPQTSMQRSGKSPAKLAAEKSTPDLVDLIHSANEPPDIERLINRLQICFAMFYEKDHSEEIKVGVIQSYIRALSDLPAWSVLRALDDWDRVGRHRPAPAQIRELAQTRIKVITDELAKRRAIEAQRIEARKEPRASPEAVAEILKSFENRKGTEE